MEYKIISANNLETITKLVNSHLSGWKLQGGIMVIRTPDGYEIFYQAMVK